MHISLLDVIVRGLEECSKSVNDFIRSQSSHKPANADSLSSLYCNQKQPKPFASIRSMFLRQSRQNTSNSTNPRPLCWNFPSYVGATSLIENSVLLAQTRAVQAAIELDLSVCEMKHFGKKALLAIREPPDAVVQMAFQLAVYHMLSDTFATYESVGETIF